MGFLCLFVLLRLVLLYSLLLGGLRFHFAVLFAVYDYFHPANLF